MKSFRHDHTHFRTTGVLEMVEFFTNIFEAEVFSESEIDGWPFIRLRLGDINITVSGPPKGIEELHPTKGKVLRGVDHLALGVDDLETVANDLRSKGAKFITEPMQSGPDLKISFIEGPDGIRIEVLERR